MLITKGLDTSSSNLKHPLSFNNFHCHNVATALIGFEKFASILHGKRKR
jgi:hypothetical protein